MRATPLLCDFTLVLAAACMFAACDDPAAGARRSTAPPPARTIAREPDDARLDEAVRLLSARRFSAARTLLERVLEERPDAARARFYIGLTYHKEGRYAMARRHYAPLLERGRAFADYSRTHYFNGWCLYNLGDVEGARRSFEVFLEDEATSGDAHFALGLIDVDEGRLESAAKHFLKAISLADDEPALEAKARTRLAEVRVEQNRLEEARAELERATGLRPQQYNAYYKLHQVARQLGHEAEAQAALELFQTWKSRVGSLRSGSP